ncbi:MAG: CoA transferase [Pseudomonadota bacterium]
MRAASAGWYQTAMTKGSRKFGEFDGSHVRSALLGEMRRALGLNDVPLTFAGDERLRSAFAVSELAAASFGAAGTALVHYCADAGQPVPHVTVDQRLASLWFGVSAAPVGWSVPPLFDPIAGDYPSADGFIRLHTNAPLHKAAALAVLKTTPERNAVAAAVRRRRAVDLESAIVAAGGCAAEMRSIAAWQAHPQGAAVAQEPLIAWSSGATGRIAQVNAPYLHGIKVLDLTRILAGPVATRLLAGLGAEVLRIDPPGWSEPSVEADVTLGKRCARLDLKTGRGRSAFLALLSEADVLVHGYREGALDALGLGREVRAAARPGVVDVSLNAYGHTGPWSGRRGFDSLVQMSCGIADAGRSAFRTDEPYPLPVQALDHATGMLMAAAAIEGLRRQRADGQGWSAKLSLARTAWLLCLTLGPPGGARLEPRRDDYAQVPESTPWGEVRRLRPALHLSHPPMRWDLPATGLGAHEPHWVGRR